MNESTRKVEEIFEKPKSDNGNTNTPSIDNMRPT